MQLAKRLGLLLTVVSVAVQAGGMTLETKTEKEIIDLCLQNNLSLIEEKLILDSAKASASIAKQPFNPRLSLDMSGLGGVKGYSGGYWQQPFDNIVRVEQLIDTSGQYKLRIVVAEFDVDIQSLLFKDALRALTREVREAYYRVVLSQRAVNIYDEILLQLKAIEQANALRWQAGDISETEFRRSELEAQKAKNDVEQAHLRLATDRQALAQLLSHGIAWQQLILDMSFPMLMLPKWTDQEWLSHALAQRADYAATDVVIQQKQTEISLAQSLKKPDLTLGLQYQHNVTAAVPDSVGVGVSMTVPLWHQHEGEVALSRTELSRSVLARQQLAVQIKTQVGLALAEFKQKQQVLARFNDHLLKNAKQLSDASGLAYRQGAISLLERLDAERNYRNVLLEYNQAQFDQTSAWLDLMYAVGQEGDL